ncbi:MAG: FAD-linked oxidase C-terminal domain-containing protein [Pseudomonadota bacterium]|nr:FAD-linked oxidase C-terminal domain-containing protein [Pseudomonadota bacterium]
MNTEATITTTSRISNVALDALADLLGDRFSTGSSILDHHGRDESWHKPQRPDGVCFPDTTEEVSEICKICYAHGVPIIAFGAGSSVEGALIPVSGGIVISTERMQALLNVDTANFDCTVQPGLKRLALNEALRDSGLFFPVDPGADASIGGMTATRASGTNAMRYGTMADAVRGLVVVLADGRILKTGTRARKSAAGYDLTHLIVGSEGTLGFVTEITLRLFPMPEETDTAISSFDTLEDAVNTAVTIQQCGLPVARLELLDDVMIDAVNEFSKTDLPLRPHLFIEFHGSRAANDYAIELVADIVKDMGGSDFEWAKTQEDRSRLWKARHDCAHACMHYRRPKRMLTCDVCVPLSALAESIGRARDDARANGFDGPILGHVGDGNYHMVLLIDPDDADEVARAQGVADRLAKHAIDVGGTSTGEHGVGIGKRKHMLYEHGDVAIDVMRGIKTLLDPKNLMNPGKVLP